MRVRNAVFVTFTLLLAVVMAGCTPPQQTPPSSTSGANGSSTATAPPTASDAGNAQLGAQIFSTGTGADGAPIQASAGTAGPCARCHGTDAKGKVGPDIRWAVLTGATSSSHAPRFTLADEAAFATAVTTGNAAGNELRPMMPHFKLTPEQISALVAYLKTL
ncbi:MAG: cytochrome c [Actinomycetota bacterium]|nr:cytochrome c [Actinomycetota bacterium]